MQPPPRVPRVPRVRHVPRVHALGAQRTKSVETRQHFTHGRDAPSMPPATVVLSRPPSYTPPSVQQKASTRSSPQAPARGDTWTTTHRETHARANDHMLCAHRGRSVGRRTIVCAGVQRQARIGGRRSRRLRRFRRPQSKQASTHTSTCPSRRQLHPRPRVHDRIILLRGGSVGCRASTNKTVSVTTRGYHSSGLRRLQSTKPLSRHRLQLSSARPSSARSR